MVPDTIIFKDKLPTIEDYWELYLTTGWNNQYKFTIEEVANALKNSWYSVSVYDSQKLLGFGRVISDGIQHALIVDLIVRSEYQGKGLGYQILDRLVLKCKANKIRDIQLFSAKDRFRFYEKYGFERRPEDAPGMQYNYFY